MMATTQRLYRSRYGKVFGVCQGIADWKDLPVDTLRLIVGVSILITGIFPGILIYALVALLLPVEPYRQRGRAREEREQSASRESYGETLNETFERLKRKVEDMEENVFNREREWDRKFHEDDPDRK